MISCKRKLVCLRAKTQEILDSRYSRTRRGVRLIKTHFVEKSWRSVHTARGQVGLGSGLVWRSAHPCSRPHRRRKRHANSCIFSWCHAWSARTKNSLKKETNWNCRSQKDSSKVYFANMIGVRFILPLFVLLAIESPRVHSWDFFFNIHPSNMLWFSWFMYHVMWGISSRL